MPSTVKVPLLGTHKKGTVIGVTLGGITVAGFMIWRGQKKAQAQAASAASAQAAAGYGYGSGGFYPDGYYGYGEPGYGYGTPPISASGGYYGYGVGVPPPAPLPAAVTTNAEWAQAAISQLTSEGFDPQAVSSALGAYELGQPITPQQQPMVQAAIGVEGYPPVAGASGYPPKIHLSGTPGGGSGGGQGGGSKEKTIEAPGHKTLPEIGVEHGVYRMKMDRLNPNLYRRYTNKHNIPAGTRVRIA